jgi:AAHS family 4-hydroxybenzoate transporter-like MFS transporter
LADRIGRRPVLLGCVLWFGLLSLATAQASSADELLLLRFLTGLGLGGAMPNAVALTSEYTPHRLRATAVMVMFCGFSTGAAVGGFAAAGLIAKFGWTSVFLVGGIAPCIALLPLYFLLPESMRFLASRSGKEARVQAILTRMDPQLRHAPIVLAEEAPARGLPVLQLFGIGRTATTLLLWVVFFMSLLDLYFVSNWLPTVIRDAGIPLSQAVLITAMFQVGGVAGTLTLGRVFDRFAPFRSLAIVYLGAALMIVLIGVAGTSVAFLVAAVLGAGVCVVGGQTAANALTAGVYPTAVRATGVGWALGIGRIGSIVGPMFGAWLISLQWETQPLFMVAAIPVLVAAGAAFLIDRLRRRRLQV